MFHIIKALAFHSTFCFGQGYYYLRIILVKNSTFLINYFSQHSWVKAQANFKVNKINGQGIDKL